MHGEPFSCSEIAANETGPLRCNIAPTALDGSGAQDVPAVPHKREPGKLRFNEICWGRHLGRNPVISTTTELKRRIMIRCSIQVFAARFQCRYLSPLP
jgi:hypothetical protein